MSLRPTFEAAGQGHLFSFYDELSEPKRARFEEQLSQIDPEEIQQLASGGDASGSGVDLTDIAPAAYTPLPATEQDQIGWSAAAAAGAKALSAGRVAAFVVAGGQGTRLGFDGPKGAYKVTPVTQKSLFQVFAEKLLAASRTYGKPIPWFIMTSIINHDETVSFFEEHEFFGLDRDDVRFFSQGLMPAVDAEGKIMLADKGEVAMNPDGHGGSLRAMVRNGCTDFMRERGIDIVSYFQVDNPLVRCIDPAFIGSHVLGKSELSSKACLKAYAGEKVGVFVQRKERVEVIEYSDLPDDLTNATDESGNLHYRAGSIAIHIFSRGLIERLGSDDPALRLPFHRANKKVPTIDRAGNLIDPPEPNGIKFEMFVFDALPFAKNPVVIETARQDDFSPVKNAEGVDSAETSRQDQLRQFARWANAAGQQLLVDETGLPEFEFEISPLFANSEAEFIRKLSESNIKIEPGVVLE